MADNFDSTVTRIPKSGIGGDQRIPVDAGNGPQYIRAEDLEQDVPTAVASVAIDETANTITVTDTAGNSTSTDLPDAVNALTWDGTARTLTVGFHDAANQVITIPGGTSGGAPTAAQIATLITTNNAVAFAAGLDFAVVDTDGNLQRINAVTLSNQFQASTDRTAVGVRQATAQTTLADGDRIAFLDIDEGATGTLNTVTWGSLKTLIAAIPGLGGAPTAAQLRGLITGASAITSLQDSDSVVINDNSESALGRVGLSTLRSFIRNNDNFVGASIDGQVITFTQEDGSTVQVTVPSGGGASLTEGALAALVQGLTTVTNLNNTDDVLVEREVSGSPASRRVSGENVKRSIRDFFIDNRLPSSSVGGILQQQRVWHEVDNIAYNTAAAATERSVNGSTFYSSQISGSVFEGDLYELGENVDNATLSGDAIEVVPMDIAQSERMAGYHYFLVSKDNSRIFPRATRTVGTSTPNMVFRTLSNNALGGAEAITFLGEVQVEGEDVECWRTTAQATTAVARLYLRYDDQQAGDRDVLVRSATTLTPDASNQLAIPTREGGVQVIDLSGLGGGGSGGPVTVTRTGQSAAFTTPNSSISNFGGWQTVTEVTGVAVPTAFYVHLDGTINYDSVQSTNTRGWLECRIRRRTSAQSGAQGTAGSSRTVYLRAFRGGQLDSASVSFTMWSPASDATDTLVFEVRLATSANGDNITFAQTGYVEAYPQVGAAGGGGAGGAADDGWRTLVSTPTDVSSIARTSSLTGNTVAVGISPDGINLDEDKFLQIAMRIRNTNQAEWNHLVVANIPTNQLVLRAATPSSYQTGDVQVYGASNAGGYGGYTFTELPAQRTLSDSACIWVVLLGTDRTNIRHLLYIGPKAGAGTLSADVVTIESVSVLR